MQDRNGYGQSRCAANDEYRLNRANKGFDDILLFIPFRDIGEVDDEATFGFLSRQTWGPDS